MAQDAQAAQAAPQNGGGQQRQEGGGWWPMLRQGLMFYAITQLAMRFLSPQKPQPNVQTADPTSYSQNAPPVSQEGVNPWQLDPQAVNPVWPIGSKVAVHVYLSQSFGYDIFSQTERAANGHLPSVSWNNITWGDWSWSRSTEYMVDIPEVLSPLIMETHFLWLY